MCDNTTIPIQITRVLNIGNTRTTGACKVPAYNEIIYMEIYYLANNSSSSICCGGCTGTFDSY